MVGVLGGGGEAPIPRETEVGGLVGAPDTGGECLQEQTNKHF